MGCLVPEMQAACRVICLPRFALAGDFECARDHFQKAIQAVRPAGGPSVTGPMLGFSYELYEGIQRYEALAGATEEAGTSHGQVAPELAEIEAPVATEAEMTSAREAVATEVPTVEPTPNMVSSNAPMPRLRWSAAPCATGAPVTGRRRSICAVRLIELAGKSRPLVLDQLIMLSPAIRRRTGRRPS